MIYFSLKVISDCPEMFSSTVQGNAGESNAPHLLETLNSAPKHLFLNNANKQRLHITEPRLNLGLFTSFREVSFHLKGII